MIIENVKVDSLGIVNSDLLILLEGDTKIKATDAEVRMTWNEEKLPDHEAYPTNIHKFGYKKPVTRKRLVIEVEFTDCKITQNPKLSETIENEHHNNNSRALQKK